jgi:TonB-dependent receptor
MTLSTIFQNHKHFLITAAALLLSQSSFAAESGTVHGRVLDRETDDALPGANVIVENTNLGDATDIYGNYVIHNVPAGKQKLRVSYVGYRPTSVDITVTADADIEVDFRLIARTLAGDTIVVTAQALGQSAAINQQLASNTISNIVSRARIKELPDVNAAEAIGRLPGISIDRTGGEASKIEIRGLSAKYNTITVNGVRLPSTSGDDRSVDLSLISSNTLDGIEVKKAVTPDMDADVLGGTVDLKLREAPDLPEYNASAQGGYTRLGNYFGNYSLTANASNRVLDSRLGIALSFNDDRYNRSADKLSANYKQFGLGGTQLTSVSTREDNLIRGRIGGSVLLDYRLPDGKIKGDAFFNQLKADGLYHINRMDKEHQSHYYDIEDRHNTTSIFTGTLGMQQDFGWISYDVSVARTASRSKSPNDRTWDFVQENTGFPGAPDDVIPINLATYAKIDTLITYLGSMFVYDTKLEENQTISQLNVQLPFRLGDAVSGYLKAGGKLRWLNRLNDQNQAGRDGIQYGGGRTTLSKIDTAIPEWNIGAQLTAYGDLPIRMFVDNYYRSDFLSGNYPLGMVTSVTMLNRMTEALSHTDQWLQYSVGTLGRDYDGVEHYYAGYVMGEFNFLDYFTLIPGIRWEADYSLYHGERYKEVANNNVQGPPQDVAPLTAERKNEFWLPDVHLIVQPVNWLKIRLARTETLTRPDYIQYTPITSMNSYNDYIRAANSNLKPARARNYDAAISVYENFIGLFTVAGFYKEISDLILQNTYQLDYRHGVPILPGLNIPHGEVPGGADWVSRTLPQVDTYINNPYPAYLRGVELDWQTHFWYLPSVLQGLILNINYTRTSSSIRTRLYAYHQGDRIPGPGPAQFYKILADSSRTGRIPDQPTDIFNVTLGYDYKGFSTRLSYLYQTDKTTFISTAPGLDNFTGPYARWDLTVQQRLTENLQVYANFNDLNGRPDENFRGSQLLNPAYIEYYGFTMDLGFRYRL